MLRRLWAWWEREVERAVVSEGRQSGGPNVARSLVGGGVAHTASFIAEGVDRYGRGFFRALEALASGKYRGNVRAEAEAVRAKAAGLPMHAPGERHVEVGEALRSLERTLRDFQPKRGGFTLAPWRGGR